MAWSQFTQLRRYPGATVHGSRTARVKYATAWWVDRAGHLTRHNCMFPTSFDQRIGHGNRRKQSFCVGMQWIIEELVTFGDLNYFSEIHNGDVIARVLHNCKIVRNKQEGYISFRL